VELIPVDEVLAEGGDDLDDGERAALHQSIDESIEDEAAGKVQDLAEIIAELRALGRCHVTEPYLNLIASSLCDEKEGRLYIKCARLQGVDDPENECGRWLPFNPRLDLGR
jgi:hypothetical protein